MYCITIKSLIEDIRGTPEKWFQEYSGVLRSFRSMIGYYLK
jgi:hypothetical protein